MIGGRYADVQQRIVSAKQKNALGSARQSASGCLTTGSNVTGKTKTAVVLGVMFRMRVAVRDRFDGGGATAMIDGAVEGESGAMTGIGMMPEVDVTEMIEMSGATIGRMGVIETVIVTVTAVQIGETLTPRISKPLPGAMMATVARIGGLAATGSDREKPLEHGLATMAQGGDSSAVRAESTGGWSAGSVRRPFWQLAVVTSLFNS